LLFAVHWNLAVTTAQDTDGSLVKFLTELYNKGYDLGIGERTVAGMMFCFPRFGRFGDLEMPRAHRASKGWRRLAPAKSRVPLTFYVIATISALIAAEGHRLMALWVLISFGTYFRPGSMMQLRRSSLLRPTAGIDNCWKIPTHQSDLHQIGKTGTTDDTLLWDVPDLLWLPKIFELITEAGSRLLDVDVWPFSYYQLSLQVSKARAKIGLKVVPYQIRHSGASWDAAKKFRSLLEIQARGGWRTTTSVLRYEKSGRMLREYARMSSARRDFCEEIATNLRLHIVDGHKIPSPPCL
jgi:hypothetical protein